MKRIPIDFAPSLRARLGITPIWIFVALIGLIIVGCAVWHSNSWFEHERRLTAKLANLQRQQSSTDRLRNTSVVTISAVEADAINAATHHLNVPWHDLLGAVEDATPSDVALLSLDPDPEHQLLRITAEAESSDAMLDYVKSLKRQSTFSSAILKQHQTDIQVQNKMLRFTINLSIAPIEEIQQ
ncbi:Tfp pilus assembly protein PilN [Oxalobacteraceae bacterium GrIS 1.18]